jgi:predicted permease
MASHQTPEKISAMLDWPTPNSLTALHRFLGLTDFYRRFGRNYAASAAPLIDLLKGTKFTWNESAEATFTNLKKTMTITPVLILPDLSKPFSLETDASSVAIGAVLSQDSHPLAFFSWKMCPRMQRSSVYVRELFAITEAIS